MSKILKVNDKVVVRRKYGGCTADTCKNCAKFGKGFKIGTNEAYNIKIKIGVGDILKIFCFRLYTSMAASPKFLLNFKY